MIKTLRRELFYGTNDLDVVVDNGAFFEVNVYNGLAYGTYGTKTFTLNENATFKVINNFDNIINSNYNIYFNSSNGGLIFNNPNEVVLFNKIGNIIYASSRIPFNFNFSRINLFDNVINFSDELTLNTLPTYSWYKDGVSNITGTFNANSVTISSNNFTEEELLKLPDLKNFIFVNKKILSIGVFL